jgi:hypothetical protein
LVNAEGIELLSSIAAVGKDMAKSGIQIPNRGKHIGRTVTVLDVCRVDHR